MEQFKSVIDYTIRRGFSERGVSLMADRVNRTITLDLDGGIENCCDLTMDRVEAEALITHIRTAIAAMLEDA